MAVRLIRTTLAAIFVAAVVASSAFAERAASVSAPIGAVASAASVQIRCYSTLDEYFGESNVSPTQFWLGIAGFWGIPKSEWVTDTPTPVVGLTANTCLAASRLHEGVTVARAYAAFTIAHELAHAAGIPDETEADCRGAATLPTVAAELGLKGAPAFAKLQAAARLSSGYNAIPAQCWRAVN